MNEFNYETIDWELEAKRLGVVFGIEGEFRERESVDSSFQSPKAKLLFKFVCPDNIIDRYFHVKDDFYAGFYYGEDKRVIRIMKFAEGKPKALTDVHLNWDGTDFHATGTRINLESHWVLAQRLFYLNLLTHELEASLKIAVSEHQKMEWMLERDELLNAFR